MQAPPARPLRIAVFSNTLVPLDPAGGIAPGQDYGGVDFGTWALTRALARQGHDVHVVTTARGGALDVRQERWTVHHLPATFQVAQAPIALSMLRRPRRLLPDIDVVLARMGNQPAPVAAARFARQRGVPLVVSYHGDATHGYGGLLRRATVRLQDHVLVPWVLSRADAIIALSEALAQGSDHLRPRRGRITVIPNGVEPELLKVHRPANEVRSELGVPEGGALLVFMGTLNPIKGLDVLLRAFRTVVDRHPGARLAILGDGPQRSAYGRQASELGLADHVRFLGFVHTGKADYLAAAEAYVLPSRSEAFPNSVVEAGWLGRAIVASRLPALAALVDDGVSGVLVDPDDPEALAQALLRLLDGRDGQALRARLGAAARAQASRWTWDAVARRQAELMQQAIREHGSVRSGTGGPAAAR